MAPARDGELRAARRGPASTSGMLLVPARARGVRRAHPLPHQRRLGAARRRAEGVLRHGLQLLRGLRPDGDGARADGDVAQGEADRRLGRAAAAGDRGEDRRARTPHGRGRGDRPRPQRDGRLLGGRGRRPPRRSATAGSTPAISGASTRRATCYLVRPIEGRDRRRQRQERLPRRDRGALPRRAPSSRSCRWSGVPDGVGEQVACAVVPDLEHDPALSARRGDGQGRGALPQDLGRSADLEAGPQPSRSGRAICPRPRSDRSSGATSRPRSRACGARTRRPRGRSRRRARAGRSPGCSTPWPRCRDVGGPTSSSAAASASWASTA